MQDHTNLRVFRQADELAIHVYRETKAFPREEMFGLVSQMRRCAVSIPSNIVEGCSRETSADYLRYLTISYGSAKELEYQASLAARLGYVEQPAAFQLACSEMAKQMNSFIQGYKASLMKRGRRTNEPPSHG